MTALAATQRWMHDALVFPGADPASAQALFTVDGRLGAAAGLAVYQRGYVQRIAARMREQFPALCHALGRALFGDFVADYTCDFLSLPAHSSWRGLPGAKRRFNSPVCR